MKKKNGFTLVELLAVIVVLAIILVLAVPSVLDTLASARRTTFQEYIEKIVMNTQTKYTSDSSDSGSIAGAGVYVYNIENDLGYTSTGDYKGYVVVNAEDVDEPHYFVYLWDSNYMTLAWDVTASKMPEPSDKTAIQSLNKESVAGLNEFEACKQSSLGTTSNGDNCYNRKGYKIVQ